MSFEGVINKKGASGLYNKETSSDNVFGLIAGAVAVSGADNFSLSKVYKFLQLKDAEAIGITANYDNTNKVLLHYHIDAFFRLNPNGELFLYGVAQSTTMKDMCDKTKGHIVSLVKSEIAERRIRGIGVVRNPSTPYSPIITNGINKDVVDAVPKAQEVINDLFSESIYLDNIVIEGRDLDTSISAVKDLRTLDAPQVSVTILQDPDIAAKKAEYAKTAAVGTILASIGVRKVSESIGSVQIEDYPQQFQGRSDFPLGSGDSFLKVALSNGTKGSSLTLAEQQLLTERAYIYGGSFEGYAGIFLNDSPTCADANNDFSYIENTRVWNKAARFVRAVLIPKVRSKIAYDADDNVEPLLVQNWINLVENRLQLMVSSEDITDSDFSIEEAEKNKPVKTKLKVSLYGIAREIENELILQ
ncbi:hypothetical protein ElyMa_002564800 [Elysia marginata]|uniref:Tail sheath protein C-terminal domain-containing protein n=1 Tax=Elysia marginata TaxID=1093978 RepID=A0AAV4GYH9_9GAST|nr:hypothetical protein ElyMa_002564800 [Elysia marginata]